MCASRPILRLMLYDGGESTSIPPALPHRGTFSTTVTVPRRSIANRHTDRRRHVWAKREKSMSDLCAQADPSSASCYMMAESRPLYLLLCLIGAHFRLQ